jgi:hypothetical protein
LGKILYKEKTMGKIITAHQMEDGRIEVEDKILTPSEFQKLMALCPDHGLIIFSHENRIPLPDLGRKLDVVDFTKAM